MKSLKTTLMTAAFLILLPNIVLSQEKLSLPGIWEGTVYMAGIDIEMVLALELAQKNESISGKMTDDWGFINCAITEPELETNILTFKVMVETSNDDHQMAFRMTIKGNKMEGQWESLGSYGECSMVKQNNEMNKKVFKIKDITGVWKGPAAFKITPGTKRILTMVLEEKNGKLSGTLSDPRGTKYSPLKVKKFINNSLDLEVTFPRNNKECLMEINFTIKDISNMKAKFSIPDMGVTGIWKAVKQ
jgi:hypothetical protein